MTKIYHNYLRKVFSEQKVKRIILTSNYMRQPFMIIGKELGIPIYDIQYADYGDYHNGYHFNNNEYKFAPDGIIFQKNNFQKNNYFSKSVKKFYQIQEKEKEELDVRSSEKYDILVISQNLEGKYIDDIIYKFAQHSNKKILYRPHPNDNVDQIRSLSLENVTLDNQNLEVSIGASNWVVGMGSTVITKCIEEQKNVIILDGYLSTFIESYIKKYNLPVVDDLRTFKFEEQKERKLSFYNVEKFNPKNLDEKKDKYCKIKLHPFFLKKYNKVRNNPFVIKDKDLKSFYSKKKNF